MTNGPQPPAFDFYRAQNKLATLQGAAERWTKKLLAASRRLLALRNQIRSVERRIERAQDELEKKDKPQTTVELLDELRVSVLRALAQEDPASAIPEIFDDVQDALEKKEASRG